MVQMQGTEKRLSFEPLELQFRYPNHDHLLLPFGANSHIIVDIVPGANVSETAVAQAFLASSLVRYNGNQIIAAIRGSFVVFRVSCENPIAHVHVIPAEACRAHRLYYCNGQLFCTGYKEKSGKCLTGSTLRRIDVEVFPDHGGDPLTEQKPYSEKDRRFSSWLNVHPWLSAPVNDGVPDGVDGSLLKVREAAYADLWKRTSVPCSPVIFYPLPAAGFHQIMTIFQSAGSTLIPFDLIAWSLRRIGAITGARRKCQHPGTFLVKSARPGTYEVESLLLKTPLYVVICDYEAEHAGHRGCFALGYPHFLCGLDQPSVYEILLKAKFTRGEPAPVDLGSSSRFGHRSIPITVSRSVYGLCQGPPYGAGIHPLPGPRVGILPLPAIAAYPLSLRGGCLVKAVPTALADWLLSQAEVIETAQGRKQTAEDRRSVKDPALEPQSKMAILRDAGVILFNEEFSDCVELIEVNGPLQQTTVSIPQPTRNSSKERSNAKYIAQRHRLISRYHEQLQLSDQAWFSICPEEIARHIGCRLQKLSGRLGRPLQVLEPFCGAGGNAVNCARMPHVSHVFAFDIDPVETVCATRLAELYGVDGKMTITTGDCLQLRSELFPQKIDAIVFSPPWGGPGYVNEAVYDLRTIQEPASFTEIVRHLSGFSRDIAVLMPRNSCLDQLVESALSVDFDRVEIEQNILAMKVKTVTVYFNGLAN